MKLSVELVVTAETVGDGVIGQTDLKIKRIEQQDDGTYTIFVDCWPMKQKENDNETI